MEEQSKNSREMRTSLFSRASILGAVIILFILGSFLLKDGPLDAGEEAPSWRVSRVNGAEDLVSLESFKGQVVVLDFWSTTCPPCVMQIPVLQQIAQEFPGVDVVGIAVGGESPSQLAHFAKHRHMNYVVAPDTNGVIATTYNVNRLPTLFIVDKTGTIYQSHEGFWPANELRQAIKEALKK